MVREGYEGLVRGNKDLPHPHLLPKSSEHLLAHDEDTTSISEAQHKEHRDDLVHNLRFGDGELLREGSGDSAELVGGRTLKGRYIIRVGWDDVRGWFTEVPFPL